MKKLKQKKSTNECLIIFDALKSEEYLTNEYICH